MKNKKLIDVANMLKSEFIGIDDVIDTLIESITPWYVTPELLERPMVLSLWGLTGTGKTSVVRRLVELLEVENKTLYFDCGASASAIDDPLADRIYRFYNDSGTSGHQEKDSIFIFDEFQHSRTISEEGQEVAKDGQRCIWDLLDSGVLRLSIRAYEVKGLMVFTEELGYLVEDLGSDKPIKDGYWPSDTIQVVKDTLDFFNTWEDQEDEEHDEENKKPILNKNKRDFLVSALNKFSRNLGHDTWKKLKSAETLGEYLGILQDSVKLISTPVTLNCSRSLVFVLGNLDEAFDNFGDFDPDMNADVFAKLTKRTNVTDIKEALKKRFRTEQISRLGNNLIIYPSLGSDDFRKVIEKELSRIIGKFKETSGIDVSVTDKFKELIYLEGVVPSQGVRTVLSTIGSVCLPKFSRILQDHPESAVIDVTGNLRSPEVTVVITYNTGQTVELTQGLRLGSLRATGACKKLAAHAIHEAGHAIMYTLAKGEIPEMILAKSSLGGGYTYGDLGNEDRQSASSKAEVLASIKVSLAGVAAEHLFFDDDHCTIGCSSDLKSAWESISDAAFSGGFFDDPFPWVSQSCSLDVPCGAITGDTEQSGVLKESKEYLRKAYQETSSELEAEREVIRRIAIWLTENYCMLPETYRELVDKYGSEDLKKALSGNTREDEYWIKALGV